MFDDPPRKNVLLLTWMDRRLLDDTVRFMNALNLHNRGEKGTRLIRAVGLGFRSLLRARRRTRDGGGDE